MTYIDSYVGYIVLYMLASPSASVYRLTSNPLKAEKCFILDADPPQRFDGISFGCQINCGIVHCAKKALHGELCIYMWKFYIFTERNMLHSLPTSLSTSSILRDPYLTGARGTVAMHWI